MVCQTCTAKIFQECHVAAPGVATPEVATPEVATLDTKLAAPALGEDVINIEVLESTPSTADITVTTQIPHKPVWRAYKQREPRILSFRAAGLLI